MTIQEKDAILSAVLDVPTPLKEVQLKPKNKLYKLLEYFGLSKPVTKMLYLRNTKMSTNYRLTAISNSLVLEGSKEGAIDNLMEIMHQNTYTMAAYIATAIHNKNNPAPGYLVNTIADEFTNEELSLATKEVYRRLDVQSFFGSTALIRSLDLM
jgi:hypothetical protein